MKEGSEQDQGIKDEARSQEQLIEFERLILLLSDQLVDIQTTDMDTAITECLKQTTLLWGVDLAIVTCFQANQARGDVRYMWRSETPYQKAPDVFLSAEDFPWRMGRIKRGDSLYLPLSSDMPPEAGHDRASFDRCDIQSLYEVAAEMPE